MALVDSDGTPLYAKITEKVRQKGRVVWDGYYYTRIIEVIFPDRTKATPTAVPVVPGRSEKPLPRPQPCRT